MEIAVIIILATFQILAVIAWIAVFIWAVKVMAREKIERPKPHKPLFKPKEPEETEEQRRERILLENVENYDGSPKGQIKL